MAKQIQVRRGLSTQWSSTNPILKAGELGFEIDTNKFKIGDETSSWTSLPYFVNETDINVDLTPYATKENPNLSGSVQVDGDLIVSGSLVYVNQSDLNVENPLIYVGDDNPADLLDIGLVGSFTNPTYQHTGFVRDATDGVWKLFKGVTDEPTSTINFNQAILDAIAVGSASIGNVSNTQIQYLQGLSSNIQNQIDSKSNKVFQTAAAKTTNYTLSVDDDLYLLEFNGTLTVNVPTDASMVTPFPVGTQISLLNIGTGVVTVAPVSGVTLNGTPGLKLRAQWSMATLIKRAANTWVLSGDLTS